MSGFCVNCGAARGEGAFCTGCGQRLAPPSPPSPPSAFRVEEPPTEPFFPPVASPVGMPEVAPEGPGPAEEPRARRFRRAPKPGADPVAASSKPSSGLVGAEPSRFRMLALSGWPGAAVAAGKVLAVVLVAAAVVGTAIAVVAVRDVGVLADAVTLSVSLLFAAVGVRVGASEADAAAPIGFLIESPALPWLLLGVVAARRAIRSAAEPLERDRDLHLALVAKVALVAAALLGALALGLPRGARRLGVDVLVNGWEAALVTFVLVIISGVVLLTERGLFPVAADEHPAWRRGVRAARSGVGAYGIVLLAMVPLVVLAGLQLEPSTDDLPALALVLPVVGGTLAVLASALVTGSTVDTAGGPLGISSFSLPPVTPPPAAPRWMLLLLAVVPVVLAWRTWRALGRERPRDRRACLAVGACVGAGFAGAGWTALWLSRLVLYSATAGDDTVRFTASLPLARSWALLLLWALAASFLPALLRRLPKAGSPPAASVTDWRKADAFADERS